MVFVGFWSALEGEEQDLLGFVAQVRPLVSLMVEALRQRFGKAAAGALGIELRAEVDGGLKGALAGDGQLEE